MAILLEDGILFVFFCVSVVLYVLILITLRINRKNQLLNGPFFVFTFYLGLSEIIATVDNWLLVKIRMMGLFYDVYSSLDPLAARLGDYLTWFMPCCQLPMTTLITVNRFTCIVWPKKAKTIWNGRSVKVLVIASWLFGFTISAPMFFWSNGNYSMINGSMVLNFYYPARMGQAYFIYSVVGLPIAILQVLAYTVMFFVALGSGKNEARRSGKLSTFATQMKLAITGFIVSISLMLTLVFTALVSFDGENYNVYYFIYKIVLDVYCQCNPYLLLLCSKQLRREVLALIRCRKQKSNTNTTMMNRSNLNGSSRRY